MTVDLIIGWSGGGMNTVFPGLLDAVHGHIAGLYQLIGGRRHVGQCRDAH